MKWMRHVLLFTTLLISLSVYAHEVRPARLQIDQLTDSTYQITWKLPAIQQGVLRLQPLFEVEHDVIQNYPGRDLGDAYITKWVIQPLAAIEGTEVQIEGLEKTITDVFIVVHLLSGDEETFLVRPSDPRFTFAAERTVFEVVKDYVILGIEHIWLGYDHLLFVLCLVWLISGVKLLVQTITAFTVAHSITLAISALGWWSLPSAPVESVIALSIVFLAIEIIRHQRGEAVFTVRYPWAVAFSFGLLHGFGFAGVLGAIGLPQSAIGLSLFGFNVGVEIGQLLFIGVILLATKAIQKFKKVPQWATTICIYAIGSLASFWTIERIIGMF